VKSIAQASTALEGLGLHTVVFDEEQAMETARLRPLTRSLQLSLSDRACLALARLRQLPVMTADRAWAKLNLGIQITVIR
jgi:ribonuclease VapC